MTTYLDSLPEKKFTPNIVIFFMGEYFSTHQPDSGLVIDADKVGLVKSLAINPTSVDPSNASTTISSITFALLDRAGIITSLFLNQTNYLQNEEVLVYLGRVGVDMDFADYFLMPKCHVAKSSKSDGAWNFSTQEKKDRLNRPAFANKTKLGASILAGTTTITVQDVSLLNPSGMVKIDKEYILYSGVDLVNNFLTGCIRGNRNTTPAAYNLGEDVVQADEIQANPIDILISLLVSSGGGGSYDTLIDGAAIDESLVDVDQMEAIRDQIALDWEFDIALSGIESLVEFLETEILFPLGLRLRTNNNSKIGLALLNRTFFDVDTPDMNDDNVTKNPSFEVSDQKIFNKIRVNWAFLDDTETFTKVHEVSDEDSIDEFGEQILELSVKGIQTLLDGQAIVEEIADQFLKRFYVPRPVISLAVQMSGSRALIGDKVDFESGLVVDIDTGLLGLEKDLEVISRAVNHQTGDVTTKLTWTWYSGMRQCYISPTDPIEAVIGQDRVTIPAGRSSLYRPGWVVRLWDDVAGDYVNGELNTILEISGNDLIFEGDWVVVLTTDMRIKFADYDDVSEQQKKYCFVGCGADFNDGGKLYQITC